MTPSKNSLSPLFSRVLLILLSILFVSIPLAVDIRAYLSFEPIKTSLLVLEAGVVFSWLIMEASLRHKEENGQVESKLQKYSLRWWLRIFFWGYFASILVAATFSVAPWVSLWGSAPRFQGLIFWGAILVVTVSFWHLMKRQISTLLNVILIAALLVSIIGIAQIFFPELTQWWETDMFLGRIFSTLGHPNYLADYLVLVIPLLYYKFLESRRWWAWLLAGGVMGVALLLTLSRGALLGVFGSLGFFVAVYAWRKGWKKVLLAMVLTPLLLAGVVVSVNVVNQYHLIGAIDPHSLMHRLVITDENLRSISSRMVLWPATWRHVLQRPFFGYGPDMFALSFSPKVPKEILITESFTSYPDRAHNFFLDSLVNVGFVGTGLLMGLLIGIFWIGARSGSLVVLALCSALFGHIISQQFEFSLTIHFLLFWSYVAMIFRMEDVPLCAWPWHMRKRVRVIAIVGSMAMLCVVMYCSGLYFHRAFTADRLAKEAKYDEAYKLMPSRVEYGLFEVQQIIMNDADHGAESAVIPILQEVKRFTSNLDYRPYFIEGIYRMLAGEYSQSVAALGKATQLAPSFPPVHLSYGRALSAGGDYTQAAAEFQHYIDLAPPYWKEKESYVSGKLSSWEAKQFEIFYKENPRFDEVFDLLEQANEDAKLKLKNG